MVMASFINSGKAACTMVGELKYEKSTLLGGPDLFA